MTMNENGTSVDVPPPETPAAVVAPNPEPVINGEMKERTVPEVEVRLIEVPDEGEVPKTTDEAVATTEKEEEESNSVEITLHTEPEEVQKDKTAFMANTAKLRSLCKRGDPEELDKFLESVDAEEIDLNVATDDGWTCLHDIITHECQFTQVARVLLKHGANVNTRDINGDSPLHSSLLYHNTDNIRLLLESGADLEAVNITGRRPIHIANDGESLQLLLDFGALPDAQDRVGNTALHFAVMAKDAERVQMLLAKDCDIHVRNRAGSSPLHLANDASIAQILLGSQADPNGVDNAGNSPMHIAVRGRHKEVVRLLLTNKADAHLTNGNGKSPYNLAKDKEMKNILMGKEVSSPVNGVKKTPANKKAPVVIPLIKEVVTPPTPVISSPSILKRKQMDENRTPTGPRLRFSEVNDYSGVEDCGPTPSKRVKVPPIYTDPQFSSDED